MANPKAWLPYFGETPQKRAALLGAGVAFSLLLHIGLPASGMFDRVKPVNTGPISVEFMPAPPLPLPPAEELNVATDEQDVDAPEDDAPAQDGVEAKAPEADEPPPPEVDEVKEPEPVEAPNDPPPEPAPSGDPPPVPEATPTTDGPLAKKTVEELLKERDKRRAERLAERRRRFAERQARRSGGKKGGAPDSGEWKKGTPESVYACTADERGAELHVMKERSLNEWITILPTVLSGFQTRPNLGTYLENSHQVVARDRSMMRRLGFIEIALPAEVLQIELDQPANTKIAIGRLDGRCLVGFRYTSQLFPFTINRVPIRILQGNFATNALVDITFFKDVSIEFRAADGAILPFLKGKIGNSKAIANNIESHYQAARLAKAVADVFGFSFHSPASAEPANKNKNKRDKRRR